MPVTYSANLGTGGIWRAVVIKDNDDGTAYVYIPALHKSMNPFKDKSLKADEFPKAMKVAWQVRTKLKKEDPIWIIFENGNGQHPMIVGQLGTTLKAGSIIVGGGYGGTTVSYSGSTNPAMYPGFANAVIDSSNPAVKTIYDKLKAAGYNDAAICGILGNITNESGFVWDTNNGLGHYDVNGPSYGLCQWHNVGDYGSGGRFTNLRNFCAEKGLDYRSLEGQVEFLIYELSSTESKAGNALKSVTNDAEGAYTAGYEFCRLFERCAQYAGGIDQYEARGGNGLVFWDQVRQTS